MVVRNVHDKWVQIIRWEKREERREKREVRWVKKTEERRKKRDEGKSQHTAVVAKRMTPFTWLISITRAFSLLFSNSFSFSISVTWVYTVPIIRTIKTIKTIKTNKNKYKNKMLAVERHLIVWFHSVSHLSVCNISMIPVVSEYQVKNFSSAA